MTITIVRDEASPREIDFQYARWDFYRWRRLLGFNTDSLSGEAAPTMPDDVLAALATSGADERPATEYEGMMD